MRKGPFRAHAQPWISAHAYACATVKRQSAILDMRNWTSSFADTVISSPLKIIGVGKGGGPGGHWPPQCLDRVGLAPPICSIKIRTFSVIFMHDFGSTIYTRSHKRTCA